MRMDVMAERSHGASTAADSSLARSLQLLQEQSLQVTFKLSGTGYEAIENIGTGAYGVVCSALHCATKKKVAIKKIPDIFSMHAAYALRTYREIRILRHFQHENIIAIREILQPPSDDSSGTLKDVYVVLDLMESDLHRIIYSKQSLTDEHVRYFLYQILRGLKYVHSANVIHRDLKPSNLLVNENCDLKIGDFGMARGLDLSKHADDLSSMMLTQYVATRWYRAPELIVSYKAYGAKIDVWSVGCIFAELLRRKYLFPGKDLLSQLTLIISTLGSPSRQFVESLGSETTQSIINRMGHKEPKPWAEICPGAPSDALDLLSRMLVVDPSKRMSVVAALQHPYLAKYHDPGDEPVCVPPFNFDFEVELEAISESDSKKDRLREKIYKEILELRKPRVVHNVPVSEFPSFPTFFETSSLASKDNGFLGTGDAAASERSVYDELGDFLSQVTGSSSSQSGKIRSKPRQRDISTPREDSTRMFKSGEAELGYFSDMSSSLFGNSLLAANVVGATPSSKSSSFPHAADTGMTRRDMAVQTTTTEQLPSGKAGPQKTCDALPATAPAGAALALSESSNLLCEDVSMHSARLMPPNNNEGYSMGSVPSGQTLPAAAAAPQDKGEQRAEATKDAKALLREALLKSQRHRDVGSAVQTPPKDERKPATTAYQRQKEREEKRKQKMEKAKLKKKREPRPPGEGTMLTKEDMEMLERWKKMHQPVAMHHPAPATDGVTMRPLVRHTTTASAAGTGPLQVAADQHLTVVGHVTAAAARSSLGRGGLTVTKTGNLTTVRPPPQPFPCQTKTGVNDTLASLSIAAANASNSLLSYGKPAHCDPAAASSEHCRTLGNSNFLSAATSLPIQQSLPGTNHVTPSIPWGVTQGYLTLRGEKEVAAITTRFSKQQMDDTLPPALTMTPRGTGGGYGVGRDVESMLGETFYLDPQSAAMDSAPLSASLIADWMDITANVGPIDLEALQQELELTSPLSDFSIVSTHHEG